jgi:hypothetical protein
MVGTKRDSRRALDPRLQRHVGHFGLGGAPARSRSSRPRQYGIGFTSATPSREAPFLKQEHPPQLGVRFCLVLAAARELHCVFGFTVSEDSWNLGSSTSIGLLDFHDPAVSRTIGRIDHQSDREPDRQPYPSVGGQTKHQEYRGRSSGRSDNADGRRLKWTIKTGLGHAQH